MVAKNKILRKIMALLSSMKRECLPRGKRARTLNHKLLRLDAHLY